MNNSCPIGPPGKPGRNGRPSLLLLTVVMAPMFGKKKKKQGEEDDYSGGVSPDKLEEDFARPPQESVIKMPTGLPGQPPGAPNTPTTPAPMEELPGNDIDNKGIPQLAAPPEMMAVMDHEGWICEACNTPVDTKISFCTYCGQPRPDRDLDEHLLSDPPVPDYVTPLSILKEYSDAEEDHSGVKPSPIPKRPAAGAARPAQQQPRQPAAAQSQAGQIPQQQQQQPAPRQQPQQTAPQQPPTQYTEQPPAQPRTPIAPQGTWTCQACGNVMVASYSFCTNCGHKCQ